MLVLLASLAAIPGYVRAAFATTAKFEDFTPVTAFPNRCDERMRRPALLQWDDAIANPHPASLWFFSQVCCPHLLANIRVRRGSHCGCV